MYSKFIYVNILGLEINEPVNLKLNTPWTTVSDEHSSIKVTMTNVDVLSTITYHMELDTKITDAERIDFTQHYMHKYSIWRNRNKRLISSSKDSSDNIAYVVSL